LSSGKRDLYILSALPMFTLVAGPWLPALLHKRSVQRVLAGLLVLIAWACFGAALWLQVLRPEQGRTLLAAGGVSSFAPLHVLGWCAVVAFSLWWYERCKAQHALAATIAAGWLIVGWWVFPQMDGQRSARDFVARLEQQAAPDRPLGLLAYHENFLWQLTRPTVNFGHRRFREGDQEAFDAAAWLVAGSDRQLLVPEEMLRPCFSGAGSVVDLGEGSGGRWYLVQGRPAADCIARGDAGRALDYSPAGNR
jgi:hypothetical protein